MNERKKEREEGRDQEREKEKERKIGRKKERERKNQLLLNTILNGQSSKNSRRCGSNFLSRTLGCKNVGGLVLGKILSFMKSKIFMK